MTDPTLVTPVPIILNDCIVQIGTYAFEEAVSSVAVVPSSSIVNFTGMKKGATFSKPTSTTWTVTMTLAQDLATPGSLHNYLLAHAGETDTLIFTPVNGEAADVTVSVILVAPQAGGDVNTIPTASVTLGVNGEPDFDSGS